MGLLSPGCACHAVWPERPLLAAVGAAGASGECSPPPLPPPLTLGTRIQDFRMDEAAPGRVRRTATRQNTALNLPHIPTCAASGVTVLERVT